MLLLKPVPCADSVRALASGCSYNNIMYRLNLSTVDLTPVPNQLPCKDGVPSGWPVWKIILIIAATALFVGGSVALLTWCVCGLQSAHPPVLPGVWPEVATDDTLRCLTSCNAFATFVACVGVTRSGRLKTRVGACWRSTQRASPAAASLAAWQAAWPGIMSPPFTMLCVPPNPTELRLVAQTRVRALASVLVPTAPCREPRGHRLNFQPVAPRLSERTEAERTVSTSKPTYPIYR